MPNILSPQKNNCSGILDKTSYQTRKPPSFSSCLQLNRILLSNQRPIFINQRWERYHDHSHKTKERISPPKPQGLVHTRASQGKHSAEEAAEGREARNS